MAQSGLAQALVHVLPAATQDFVRQSLDTQAQRQALRHLLIRDALGRIDENLQRLGLTAILLKGAAQLACGGPRVCETSTFSCPPLKAGCFTKLSKVRVGRNTPGPLAIT